MKRGLINTAIFCCLIGAMLFVSRRLEENPPKTTASPALDKIASPTTAPLPAPMPTPSVILPVAAGTARLNDPELTADDDLAIIATLLSEYRRHLGGNPVGDNDEITAAMLGANPKRLACLPAGSSTFLDPAGRLIDRWGNPYFFHALSGTHMDIISAGPDGILHTGDDLLGSDGD